MLRFSLAGAGVGLAACLLLTTGCEASVQATAPNVANPVLLGPVDRVGGHRAGPSAPGGHFVAILEDSTSASGNGRTTVSVTTLGHDARNVSFWILRATRAHPSLDVHLDAVDAGGGCLFALFYGECHETAVVGGHVTQHTPGVGVAPPVVDGVAEEPEPGPEAGR